MGKQFTHYAKGTPLFLRYCWNFDCL